MNYEYVEGVGKLKAGTGTAHMTNCIAHSLYACVSLGWPPNVLSTVVRYDARWSSYLGNIAKLTKGKIGKFNVITAKPCFYVSLECAPLFVWYLMLQWIPASTSQLLFTLQGFIPDIQASSVQHVPKHFICQFNH